MAESDTNDTNSEGTGSAVSPANTIDGTGGFDTIHGTDGADIIDAGQSDDTVYAGEGNDTIFGGDAGDASGGAIDGAKTVDSFTFSTSKIGEVVHGSGAGSIGDSIRYDNIAIADDGTSISVRITVVDQSHSWLDIDLGWSDGFPVYLNDENNLWMQGQTADIQVEFLDANGDPISINSNFTFRDIDNSSTTGQESVRIDKTDITGYAVSGDPPSDITATDQGETYRFGSTGGSRLADEDHWLQIFFKGQSSLEFTLTARGSGTGYGFDTADFTNEPVVTEIEASGDDLIFAGIGDDLVFGGGGADTIHGEDGADRLSGDAGDDVLYGGAGDDVLLSSEGNDLLYGGAGDDIITFADATGVRRVEGGDGHDTLDLGALDHGVTIDGAGSRLTATGGEASLSGIERFIATGHDDILNFSEHGTAVTVDAGAGNDEIRATGAGDLLYGGEGSDTIFAGGGGDTVFGGTGNDEIDAGAGEDLIDLSGGGENTVQGGDGFDIVDYSGALGGVTVELNGLVNGGDAINHVEAVIGSAYDDVISGSNESGDNNDDVAETGSASGAEEHLGIRIDTGKEYLFGGDGNDLIDGRRGDEVIFGGAGDDTIIGGLGNETMTGGEGRDTFVIEDRGGDDLITDFTIGEDVFDFTDLHAQVGGRPLDTNQVKISDTVGDGSGHAVLEFPSLGTVTLEGVSVFDLDPETLEAMGFASSDDMVLAQNPFFSELFATSRKIGAGGGNDEITGSSAAETIFGGGGDDTISLGGGADTVSGGEGDDLFVLSGDFAGASIDGSYGTDALDASGLSQGIRVIADGSGGGSLALNTAVPGGSSAEGPVSSALPPEGEYLGEVTISAALPQPPTSSEATAPPAIGQFAGVESFTGTSGDDLFDFSADSDGTGVSVAAGAGADSIQGSQSNDILLGEGDADTIVGHDGHDFIDGGSGNDSLDGGDGGDTLHGEAGDDMLGGGAGADTLFGGDGADTLAGGSGDDVMSGGSGDDVFALNALGGSDSISDFTMGEDLLDTSALQDGLGGEVTANEVAVTTNPDSTQTLTFPNGETVAVSPGTVDTSTWLTQFNSLVAMGVPPCFATGTLIATARGDVPVERLESGELVPTADHGMQPLRWIGRHEREFATREDRHRPILIRAGALGAGAPRRDLVVSPQHRIVVSGPEVREMFGVDEALALAKSLLTRPGVRVMRGRRRIVYHSLLFERHEVILAEGAATESFRPGPIVMDALPQALREEIFAIFPRLRDEPVEGLGDPARRILKAREAKELCARLTGDLMVRDFEMWDADLHLEMSRADQPAKARRSA